MKKKILLLGLLSTMLLASCGSKDIDDVKDTTTVVDTTTNTATSTTTSAQDTTTDTATSTTTSTADTTTSTTTSIVTTTDDVVEKVYVKIYEDVSNTKLLKQVEYEKGHKFKNEELAEIVVSKPNHEFVKWVDGTGADFSCGSRGKTLNEDLYIYPIFNEIPVTLGTLLNYTPTISTLTGQDYIDTLSEDVKENMSTPGFVNGKITDFSQYKDTPAYVKVSTAEQLVTALKNAKEDYKTTYNADGTISQTLNSEGTVKVIEIENDIDLGYNHMTSTAKGTGIVDDFCRGKVTNGTVATMSNMWKEHGISQIKIEGTSNLLIYSKNGAKLTHGGFKLTSCTDIAIRNLEFDEMWQWEDANTLTPSFTVGDCDSFSWAYMKISNCGNVWIDHCKFGKAFDGMIDISSPDYTANAGVAFRAPYGANGECNIQVSNCDFHSGDDDPNGYIYKMMEEVEADYQKTVSTSSTYDEDYTCQYQYYKILRDQYNLTFDEILYGIALPQKKAFLCGDREDYYEYNLNLNLGFSGCQFRNIEDRIPKVRGGFCYMYNSIIDNREYYHYRDILIEKGAKDIATAYPKDDKSSYFKCALVSQCFVIGVGASICSNNNIILGVDSLIKNNDKAKDFGQDKARTMTNAETCGGYKYLNTYMTNNTNLDQELTTISDFSYLPDTADPAFAVDSKYFSWHTDDGEEPFEPVLYAREELAQKVYDNIGTSTNIGEMFLYINVE